MERNGEEGCLGWRSCQSLRSNTGLERNGPEWNGWERKGMERNGSEGYLG
jgi:hypothetical protein